MEKKVEPLRPKPVHVIGSTVGIHSARPHLQPVSLTKILLRDIL